MLHHPMNSEISHNPTPYTVIDNDKQLPIGDLKALNFGLQSDVNSNSDEKESLP